MIKKPKKTTQLPHVSAVIPTFKGRHLLEKYLPAVIDCLQSGDELIVVEDTGPDDTVAWMRNRFKMKTIKAPTVGVKAYRGMAVDGSKKIDVLLLENIKNQRFGETSNRGVRAAKHDLIFLINSDVAPRKTVLKYLLPYFQDKDVFAVGPLEIEHGKKSGKNKLWFERGMFIHSKADHFRSGPTAWVSGGSGVFDKQKWLAIGGFDKLFYPAYWEDIDLSFQARKRGWKVLFEPKAVVDHNHETTNASVFGQQKMERMSWNNATKFVWKNGDFWQKLAYLLWRPYWWMLKN
ncbi:MAG: glycosyltransferase [Candidatus Paceibacterota bacterium]